MALGEPTPERRAKDRQWRQKSADRYAKKRQERAQDGPGRPITTPRAPREHHTRSKAHRRNDGPWRKECEAAYGVVCIVPGCGSRDIEMDHIVPRSKGGKSVVENGIPLCGDWSKNRHHPAKTAGDLQFDWAWLTPRQRTYLATIGWVDWDEEGLPFGEGHRHFTERRGT